MPNAYTRLLLQLLAVLLAVAPSFSAWSATAWTFAVSGDSRNCGNAVMPAIAAAVHANGDPFHWHLGDLRRTRGADVRSHVYGTLTGRVDGVGEVALRFHELDKVALQRARSADYEAADAAFSFAENPLLERLGSSPPAPSCLVHGHEN
ncbi:MAG: hypothetical protein WCH32_01595 [Pseudomonadota bacterium]